MAVLVEDQPPADEYQGGTIAAPIAKADHPGLSSTSRSDDTVTLGD